MRFWIESFALFSIKQKKLQERTFPKTNKKKCSLRLFLIFFTLHIFYSFFTKSNSKTLEQVIKAVENNTKAITTKRKKERKKLNREHRGAGLD
jgi:hypothetical protein